MLYLQKKYHIMKKVTFCILAYLGVLSWSINAQDSTLARQIIRQLSSPEMFGRGCSYGGDKIAANFISNKCKELNLKSLGKNFFQTLSYPAFKMEGECYIEIGKTELVAGKDYYIESFSYPIKNTKIPVLYTSSRAMSHPDSLQLFVNEHKRNIKNSIVFIKNSETGTNEEKAFLNSIRNRNPFGSQGIIVGQKQLPMAVTSHYPEEWNYALIYVKDSVFAKHPKHISIAFNNELLIHNSQNVCAYIEGNEVADSFIVFSAHYDHLGTIGNKAYYPGAHDNASGVAAVLDLAKYFSQNNPKYSVVFLFFCGEETGLIGSHYFTENPLIPLKKIKMFVNIDMFCGGDEGIMIVNSKTEQTSPFFETITKINSTNNYLAQIKSRPNAANSDHYFFSQHCPAIFIYTMGGKYGGYHDIYDTCDKCGLENYEKMLNLIIESTKTHFNL